MSLPLTPEHAQGEPDSAWRSADGPLRRAHADHLHAFLPRSRANGPGWRSVVWVQGCSLGCPECFNPLTHAREGGEVVTVDARVERILAAGTQGVTVSGGEPLQQAEAVLALLERVRAAGLSAVLFTGFAWEEIQRMPVARRLSECVDVLIAGRYEESQRVAAGLRGSANKTVHLLSARYSREEIEATPEAEAVVMPDGRVVLSGLGHPGATRSGDIPVAVKTKRAAPL